MSETLLKMATSVSQFAHNSLESFLFDVKHKSSGCLNRISLANTHSMHFIQSTFVISLVCVHLVCVIFSQGILCRKDVGE